PEDVARFGPDAVVQIPDAFTDATKDGRRREQGVFRRPHNVGIDTVRNDSTTAPGGRILAVRMRRAEVLCGDLMGLNGRWDRGSGSGQGKVRRKGVMSRRGDEWIKASR